MSHANFVHLHLHTYYSLLDGACSIEGLVEKAKAYHLPALAMTDHGNLFAAVEFYSAMMKAGVKPILGCECYILREGEYTARDPRLQHQLSHITLLAKNHCGYQNLCRLVSESHLKGFYYKPRIDKALLRQYSSDLVAFSGCMHGVLSVDLAEGQDAAAEKWADDLAAMFGEDRFYIELMRHGISGQEEVNQKLIALAKCKGLPLIATNDVHYLEKSDAEAQDLLLCIQTGKTVGEEKRMRMSSDEFYFKSPDQMTALFEDLPEAIHNTVTLSQQLNVELDFKTYHFPKFEPPNKSDLATYLETESWQGLEQRLGWFAHHRGKTVEEIRPEYEQRLKRELDMVTKMGFAGYFLIVADFIAFAKSHRLPVGPGRGSAAGSLVAICLGITNIDPLAHDLLFERFLNPERISMPDMDIDFCMRRRDEVIHYVAQKYGNVSQIITFGKMKARAVVRDVGRAMAMTYSEVDRIAKLIPATLNMTLAAALEIEPKLSELADDSPQVKRLLEVARRLEGFPRHASTHAAGVVISDEPLTEYLPLCLGQKEELVTQFDMKAVEKVGLIKFDFLGLKTLTVIDDCLRLIEKTRGKTINIDDIPLDDEPVYSKLSEGDTSGVFQLESQGMTTLVIKLKPNVFSDIVALVALFRPGPLGSGMVDDFIDRKHARTGIVYPLPQLEPILRDTYGVIVYQEQVMRIASELASFSLGDADLLRRAMGKKRPEEMAEQREKFLKGASVNKIPTEKAEYIFDLMAKFAEYGFNKSHSAAYALVSYQTAYLKCHYPTEYMAALLTSEQGNTDKVLKSIADCRAHGMKVLPPDVNESERDFSIVGEGVIRFGLGGVKNVGEAAIESIVEARREGGPFTSIMNFCRRIDGRKVNRRVLESLVKCGAFDFTKRHRALLMSQIDRSLDVASREQRDRRIGQEQLFGGFAEVAVSEDPETTSSVDPWHEQQMLAYEKETLGFYITGHPLSQYEELLKIYSTSDTAALAELTDKRHVRFGGIVTRLREITTRKGDRMGFVVVEDLKGMTEVIVFADVYAEAMALLKTEQPIFVVGMAEVDEESCKVLAEKIYLLDDVPLHLTKSVHFYLNSPDLGERHLRQLKNILAHYPGGCPSFIHLIFPEKAETVLSLPSHLNVAPEPRLVAAVQKLFGQNVTHFSTQTHG